jgi:hypothetical protein
MARKSITTSHSVVACDVCGRRLLRGENAEVFIAGGARRMVCDLCTARAAHEGWMREGLDEVGVRANGGRRASSLLGRLRQRRDAFMARGEEEAEPESEIPAASEPRTVHAVPTNAQMKMARAVEVFNAGEHPRTVAGISRSLGAPFVTVRPSPTEGAVVSIVVGWELTWYRYEVDLGNEAAGVRVTDQGSELSELDESDRASNAAAHGDGTLDLLG